MQLTEKVIKKIETVYDSVQNYCSYVCLSGSSRCEYLDFHRDVDVFFVCPDKESYHNCCNVIHHDQKISKLVEELKEKNKVIVIPNTQERENQWRCEDYIYLYNDTNPLLGDASLYHHKDIFCNKEQYFKALVLTNEILQRQLKSEGQIGKNMYHLLTGVYMLQNDSPNLTEEQIENIKMCHQNADEDFYKIQILLYSCGQFLTKKRHEIAQNAQKNKKIKEEKS